MVIRAGRTEEASLIFKSLILFLLILITIYLIVTETFNDGLFTRNTSLDPLIISSFLLLITSFIVRSLVSTCVGDYLLIYSLLTFGVLMLMHELMTYYVRGVNVKLYPFLEVITFNSHSVISVDLGQLSFLGAILLITHKLLLRMRK